MHFIRPKVYHKLLQATTQTEPFDQTQMQNNQETHNLRSNDLISKWLTIMESDPKQILRGTDDCSFYSTFRNPPWTVGEMPVTMNPFLESDDKDIQFSSKHRTSPVLDMPQTLRELLNHPHLCACIRTIALEEAGCIYAFKMNKLLTKHAKKRYLMSFRVITMRQAMALRIHRSTFRRLF